MEASPKAPKTDLTIKCDDKEILGTGFQSVVLKGSYNGTVAAIKRVVKSAAREEKREENALKILDHLNVIKLYGITEDGTFK